MCGQRLAMPTAITGQNGAVLKQTSERRRLRLSAGKA